MDLSMRRLSGIEAAHMVLTGLPGSQVVLLTAYEDEGLVQASEQAGVFAYLVKGCSVGTVVETIRRAWEATLLVEAAERLVRPLGE